MPCNGNRGPRKKMSWLERFFLGLLWVPAVWGIEWALNIDFWKALVVCICVSWISMWQVFEHVYETGDFGPEEE